MQEDFSGLADVSQTVANVLATWRTGKPYSRWLVVFDNLPEPWFEKTDRIFTAGLQVTF